MLDAIERLPVHWVIPGHGAPFDDVADALARARSRLAAWLADPARHARHAARVILKYHAMEEQAEPLADWAAWCEATPLLHTVHRRFGAQEPFSAWCRTQLNSLVQSGALALGTDGVVRDV